MYWRKKSRGTQTPSRKHKIKVIQRDKLCCVQCAKPLSLIGDLKAPRVEGGDFHHIVPMIYGGENEPFNICLLCRPCHLHVHSGSETQQKYIAMFESFIRTGRLFQGGGYGKTSKAGT